MAKKLFLLDGMALAYRAHFALMARPILTSKGVNSSALFGFTQTLLDVIKTHQPSHIAVVFDTEAPTQRHKDFAGYKAHREAMPEELSSALPHIKRLIEAFHIPVLTCDGWEADDIIGTLVKRAEKEEFTTYMVTPDKDFGQLVSERTFLYRPSRMGDGVEILGVPEILNKWGIQRPAQVIDLLGLMGDASDNIPGVPGVGPKTAAKLIAQYDSVENLLAHTAELKGKLRETLEANREDALLSKRLATIDCAAPCGIDIEQLRLQPPDAERLMEIFVEFEFNSIGRRVFGDDFKASRSVEVSNAGSPVSPPVLQTGELSLGLDVETSAPVEPVRENLKTIADVPHDYRLAAEPEERRRLIGTLLGLKSFCFDTETDGLDPKSARLIGIAFSFAAHSGFYVPLPADEAESDRILGEFRPVFEAGHIGKVGHNLKFDLSVLKWRGIPVAGKLFDTMVAHSLVEPEMRHGMDHLSEVYLGYTPVPITKLIGDAKGPQISMAEVPVAQVAEYAAEDADVTWQLRGVIEPLLKRKGQERVFYEIEAPLVPVLVDMEFEGIRVEAGTLAEIGIQLGKEIEASEKEVHRIAGQEFNLNSTRQLGAILFETLKISDNPKKTKTGLYATDEQTLLTLGSDHEIVRRLLDYRELTKLKSTYVDALPTAIWPKTGRIHTTYHQTVTATGRLNSQNPNLQNIPIRTEQGKEIRKAFVPRDDGYVLLSADYSQIELRIIAALSREPALLEAFRIGGDVHTTTAARVFGVTLENVTGEMRRKAKMVNYGIAYGISAFGLAQRLGIPRKEAAAIIEQYFAQFSGIRKFMNETIAFARSNGYVETVSGRRRYIRDIRSANATIRNAAERNAINAPIQGTAADMIKIAMAGIHRELARGGLRTRMLLQVHDELVFDLYIPEKEQVLPLVEEKMKTALALDVPITVEMGTGRNWLEAH
jgi:DNA polymerase-1